MLLILAANAPVRSENPEQLGLQGRVECADDSRSQIECGPNPVRFVFLSDDGTRYRFVDSDPKTAMFHDPRVRERKLFVTAWLRDENRIEIVKVHSIREGKLYDIHYFCEVCNITAYGGGPCWCCQKEFELREIPAGRGAEG
ncbi:MAG TPA: hypothetical protein VMN76_09030 [Acidobacteriota bacterium]|nr:hypothetical protein [Acidobacteriota bacterium]